MNGIYQNKWLGVCMVLAIAMPLLFGAALASEPASGSDKGGITGRVFLDENADTEFRECDCDCGLDDIPVRLYRDHCGGLIIQTARTDAEGYFHFHDLQAGDYCLMPQPKLICEGYKPTTPITLKVQVKPGETVEAEWFGFDHFLDRND